MFISLTPNPVLDINLLVAAWTPGQPLTALRCEISLGGKGLDASVALRHLGQATIGLHFAGGKTGRDLLDRLAAYGIQAEPVWVGGETRTAYIIAEQQPGRHTHVFAGELELPDGARAEILARMVALLSGAAPGTSPWLLTGGKLPPGLGDDFYYEATCMARDAGARVLVDMWRAPVLSCLPARPDIVKMNRDEFGWTFGGESAWLTDLIDQARAARAMHAIPALVITCGADGILALTPEGDYHAVPPAQIVVNAAGAGDAASAGLVWRLSQGDGWAEALTWAAAISAASVRTEGTADLDFNAAVQIRGDVVCRPL